MGPLQGDTGPAKLVLVQDALDPQPPEVFLPDHDFQVSQPEGRG